MCIRDRIKYETKILVKTDDKLKHAAQVHLANPNPQNREKVYEIAKNLISCPKDGIMDYSPKAESFISYIKENYEEKHKNFTEAGDIAFFMNFTGRKYRPNYISKLITLHQGYEHEKNSTEWWIAYNHNFDYVNDKLNSKQKIKLEQELDKKTLEKILVNSTIIDQLPLPIYAR